MSACDDHLRRTDLIAALAPSLDIAWRQHRRPAGVLSRPDDELLALDRSGAAARRYAGFDATAARARIEAAALTAWCRCDAAYPARLLELADPPAVLHVLGDAAVLEDERGIAVVGARRGTPYGLEVATQLARSIARAGLPVVSGLALGVDAAAHTGALHAGGTPVAVLATGADRAYPAVKRRLHIEVARRGAVVSELPPGFPPFRWAFVARNRLIAALAAVTVVVEGTERSGSLTTADFAAQTGRLVGAVPGPVTSRWSEGTNGLIAAGALVVRDARDVLDVVLGPGARPEAAPPPLEPHLRTLLAKVERGRGTLAELATSPETVTDTLSALTELEFRGLVRRDFGGRYVRAAA